MVEYITENSDGQLIATLVKLREWCRGDRSGDGRAPTPPYPPDSAKCRACPWSGFLLHPGRTVPQLYPWIWTQLPTVIVPDPFPTPAPRCPLGSGVSMLSLNLWGSPHPPLGLSCKPVWAPPGPGCISQTCSSFYPLRGGGPHLLLVIPCQ